MGHRDADDAMLGVNEVRVVGRLAAPPIERELPSGDRLLVWRVIVPRAPGAASVEGRRPVTVDTLDCVSRRGVVRRCARSWAPGDVVEVSGALRRRFWRAAGGAVSRCEVGVSRARRLRRGGSLG